MTKLSAINTILMYINENPVTQAMLDEPTPIISITLADTVLDEQIQIFNAVFSADVNDISLVGVDYQDYLVKRASRQLYTRKIGFEDKGVEVILLDEKQALGTCIKA